MESSLPSSSPIRFSSTDIPSDDTSRAEPQTQSMDSASMWSAVGSLPRSPATFQFDEYESKTLEDGEVYDEGPPSNQLAEDPDRRAFLEELDDYVGEQHEHHQRFPAPTHRKRTWEGSQGSEELSRTARRPRRDEATPVQPSLRLPSVNEMLANPWGGVRGAGVMQRDVPQPVAFSTPMHVSEYATLNHRSRDPPYMMDSQANYSGQPPTPFSRASSVAKSSRPTRRSVNRTEEMRSSQRAGREERDREESMRIDELYGDEETNALLKTPPRRRTTNSRDSTQDLRQVLECPSASRHTSSRPGEDNAWRGGYAPKFWDSAIPGRNGRQRVPAVEDLETGGDGSVDDATFSPIPHTKAWQYQQEIRRNQEARMHVEEPHFGDEQADAEMCGLNRRTAGPGAFTDATPGREATQARASEPGRPYETREAAWRYDGAANETMMDTRDDWGASDMVPTAVAQSPNSMDVPSLAENPRDIRWEVHFDDPERLVHGQSAEWQREMWKDSTAVMFTAYNYRLTTNGVVNRHVESAVTAITTFVTGEANFSVVPPDPDRERHLAVRDLPFTWAIRGLTTRGAARMAAIRVASSKGVSIITYPRRLSNPRWVLGLVGFLRPDAAVIRAAVMNVLRASAMYEWLSKLTKASKSLRRIPTEERVEYILSTLEVKIADLEDGDFTANVFIDSPTDDMNEWRDWVAHLRSCKYNNFMNGTGTARRVFWCSGCRGVDHDTMKCLFPTMDGWQGTGCGARSHTAEMLGAKKFPAAGGRGGATRGSMTRGGGAWKGKSRESRDWEAGAGHYDGERGGTQRRGEGRRPYTPRGRSPWNGDRQQQRRYATQQWSEEPMRGWYE